MSFLSKCLRFSIPLKNRIQSVPNWATAKYSVYPPHYGNPIYKKEELNKLYENGEIEKLKLIPVKAAKSNESCSEFHDPVVAKFINYMMHKGQKKLARQVLEKTFEKIKRIQLEKYNRETDIEKKYQITIDPVIILKKAIANCKPLLKLTPVKRGGSYYQVPVPITDKESTFFAMRWFVHCGREKDKSISFADFMATEFINASNNEGRVWKKKLDLHKQCEANRAYAHYRWS
ncbi:28S ribosomal protein S7, mitochondrial [Adelges cooleyi]|uniref:28S ribosomal protein S7, mitochondrial n=1 Tax=Adelges cooleyi TaxID=133065 RepID=UPI00217F359A|nr:28S ribosomal protein S7, mitochondrial [Adelges cooleyi]XP_050425118.1 28S ribosomal protein S7, mitochondrial [Adelges cooleyi]